MSTNINNVNTDTLNVYNNTSVPSTVCSQCHQNKLLTEYRKNFEYSLSRLYFQ